MANRPEPIVLTPLDPPADPKQQAGVIFLHGFGDDGAAFQGISEPLRDLKKLPYATWVFPTALENRDAMSTAWYNPTGLSPFPSQRPELEDEEDEDGMRQSMAYVEGLVADLEARGVPTERIVLAGFSQGCAMSLFVSLLSEKYAGRLAGTCGLCGYLPLADKMKELTARVGGVRPTKVFLARGKKDMLVPKRYHTIAVDMLTELGAAKGDDLVTKEYDGMGHSLGRGVLADMTAWLEAVIPPV